MVSTLRCFAFTLALISFVGLFGCSQNSGSTLSTGAVSTSSAVACALNLNTPTPGSGFTAGTSLSFNASVLNYSGNLGTAFACVQAMESSDGVNYIAMPGTSCVSTLTLYTNPISETLSNDGSIYFQYTAEVFTDSTMATNICGQSNIFQINLQGAGTGTGTITTITSGTLGAQIETASVNAPTLNFDQWSYYYTQLTAIPGPDPLQAPLLGELSGQGLDRSSSITLVQWCNFVNAVNIDCNSSAIADFSSGTLGQMIETAAGTSQLSIYNFDQWNYYYNQITGNPGPDPTQSPILGELTNQGMDRFSGETLIEWCTFVSAVNVNCYGP